MGRGKILKKFEATSLITCRPKSEERIAECTFITVSWNAVNYVAAKCSEIQLYLEGATLEEKLFSK